MKRTDMKRPLFKFFLSTYLIFWGMLGLTGLVISLGVPAWVRYIMPVICAWSPTIVFLLMFRRLYPGMTLKEYLRRQFKTGLSLPILVLVIAVQIVILAAATGAHSILNQVQFFSALTLSAPMLLLGFMDSLIRGPLGEELGWRGFALNELQKKHTPLFSALVLGLIWGFWHAPLWFLTTGFTGNVLMQYIPVFMISIICASIVITAFYNMNKNLIVPILIHQFFNFLLAISRVDLVEILYYVSIGYLLFAILLIWINPKEALYGKRDTIKQAKKRQQAV